jgi:hypothetical protein
MIYLHNTTNKQKNTAHKRSCTVPLLTPIFWMENAGTYIIRCITSSPTVFQNLLFHFHH